eukprot:GHVU01111446.1.p1 GENE.GHVU01111446.1~~GHVU01111446.1.p1  ORF type:complete len:422 (+),score=47.26 GHVU01111446.1:220-1485(+)
MLPLYEQNRNRSGQTPATVMQNQQHPVPSYQHYQNAYATSHYAGHGSGGRVEGGAAQVYQQEMLSPNGFIDDVPGKMGRPQAFSMKEKRRLTDLERYLKVYGDMEPIKRLAVIVGFLAVFAVLFFLIYLGSPDFATVVILSAIVIALASIAFSMWLLAWILHFDEGTDQMREISEAIRLGSEGFFAVQYGTIAKISGVFAVLIVVMYIFKDPKSVPADISQVGTFGLAIVTGLCFVMGALCSGLSGYAGMWVSIRANVRVASAARRCYNEALQLCFRGGAFSSIINVALAVGGISFVVLVLRILYPSVPFTHLPLLLVGYGFGASLVAMFAQLGGGIYTKGADVGADLVGKVEAGIPEDDPRNPAVVADLVGDNVGDCAGQCADLFESIAAEIISAMILGGGLAKEANMSPDEMSGESMSE